MTNSVLLATNKLLVTAAYKYVAMAVMMTNCNLFLQQTHLAEDAPVVFGSTILSQCSVAPPRLMGLSGSVVTTNYFFGFGHDHLANFWQKKFRPSATQSIAGLHEQWSKMPSQIGTNEARLLALDWLTGLGVDVVALDKKYPCKVTQKFFHENSGGGLQPLDQSRTSLPIFDVSWGSIPVQGHREYSFPAVAMTIFGPTKQLAEYHLFDDALMLRPKLEVKNYEQLLAITNGVFAAFGGLERSNLLKQFSAGSP